MPLILFGGFSLKKMWKNMEKGLGKYRMGGYGQIGVYRVKGRNYSARISLLS